MTCNTKTLSHASSRKLWSSPYCNLLESIVLSIKRYKGRNPFCCKNVTLSSKNTRFIVYQNIWG